MSKFEKLKAAGAKAGIIISWSAAHTPGSYLSGCKVFPSGGTYSRCFRFKRPSREFDKFLLEFP